MARLGVVVVALLVSCYLWHFVVGSNEPPILSRINVHAIKYARSDLANISVSPTTIANGDYVVVSYGSSTPQVDDWVAAYSPSSVDITQSAPIKYQFANTSNSYLSTGLGSLK